MAHARHCCWRGRFELCLKLALDNMYGVSRRHMSHGVPALDMAGETVCTVRPRSALEGTVALRLPPRVVLDAASLRAQPLALELPLRLLRALLRGVRPVVHRRDAQRPIPAQSERDVDETSRQFASTYSEMRKPVVDLDHTMSMRIEQGERGSHVCGSGSTCWVNIFAQSG